MEAKEFIETLWQMCESYKYCDACPLNRLNCPVPRLRDDADTFIGAAEQWRTAQSDAVCSGGIDSIKVTLDVGAFMPTRAHDTDAGLDIMMPDMPDKYWDAVPAHGSLTIDTGVHIEIPQGYVGMLKSKSGLNVKYGITSEGVIDSGYTGSIKVKLYNHIDTDYCIDAGDKISQLVILPVITPALELVDALPATDRGDNGFGSTGR